MNRTPRRRGPGRFAKIKVKKKKKIVDKAKKTPNTDMAECLYGQNRVDTKKNTKKRRGQSPAVAICRRFRRDQRRSWRTLCCAWLASDSAEVAIDWRGGMGSATGACLVDAG